ncbi:hypothetical protein G6F31_021488 [Rhizopus arrhizus]|nr:hypothetical protein G6F31_021488 [Rhizopus arrhizus]
MALQTAADAPRGFLEIGEGLGRGTVQHHADDDQRGHVDLCRFQQRDRLLDHAFGLELFHAAQAGGGTQVHARAQVEVRDLRVVLQHAQDVAVDAVQARGDGHLICP